LKNGTVNNFGFLSAFLIKKHYYYGRAATKKILFFQFLKNHFTSGQALTRACPKVTRWRKDLVSRSFLEACGIPRGYVRDSKKELEAKYIASDYCFLFMFLG
ncbi:MAG TPA: hypothetical protein VJK54_04330, partial [Chthoniobacterales bacterium]|nr:hypothetical protein [Chthoniobacterales bacterium]